MTPRAFLVLFVSAALTLAIAAPSPECFAQPTTTTDSPFPSPWGSEGEPPVKPAAPGGYPLPPAPPAPPVQAVDTGKPADRYQKEEAQIPKNPSAPPVLTAKPPEDSFHCQRFFAYQGKRYGCDSNVHIDGDRLRPIMHDVPSAIVELDIYQANRIKVRNSAYFGGAGLMIAIAGSIVSTQISDSDTQRSVRNVSAIGGVGLAVGAFLYSLSYIRSNEQHLVQAVNNFNVARPKTPIDLRFNLDL